MTSRSLTCTTYKSIEDSCQLAPRAYVSKQNSAAAPSGTATLFQPSLVTESQFGLPEDSLWMLRWSGKP